MMTAAEELEATLRGFADKAKASANAILNDGQNQEDQNLIFGSVAQAVRRIHTMLEAFQKLNLNHDQIVRDISHHVSSLKDRTRTYFDICEVNPRSASINPEIIKNTVQYAQHFSDSVTNDLLKHFSNDAASFFLETHEARKEAAAFSSATRIAIDEAAAIKSDVILFIEQNQASLAGISFAKQLKELQKRQNLWLAWFVIASAITFMVIICIGMTDIPRPITGAITAPSFWDYIALAKRAAFVVLTLSALSISMKLTFNQFLSARKIADIYRNKISIIQHFRTTLRSQTDEATKNAMHLELMKILYADIPYNTPEQSMEFNVAPVMNIAESIAKK